MSKQTKWVIDTAHSTIDFKIKHMMVSNVKGSFKDFNALINTNGTEFLSAEIDFWMDPASIDTGDPKRDGHLISSDFFDTETHKEVTFKSTRLEKSKGENSFSMWGDLTIKGISQSIQLDVEHNGLIIDPWGNEKAGFTITGKVSRKEWNLNWNAILEGGGLLISDEVKIDCELELTRIDPPD